jgi:hypothetical protein
MGTYAAADQAWGSSLPSNTTGAPVGRRTSARNELGVPQLDDGTETLVTGAAPPERSVAISATSLTIADAIQSSSLS